MSTKLKRYISTLLLVAALTVVAGPAAVSSAEVTGATGAASSDPAIAAPALSLSPEEIAALQEGDTSSTDDKSVVDKVSDFVTDNAPFIILGIIVLAAILAGIFIMRGRNKEPKMPKAATTGAPASASEIRRRKRAAMQRTREEERLRRKAGLEGRQAMAPSSTLPLSANLPLDPVDAEKQSARDQVQAAAAVARFGPTPTPAAGPVPAPISPSQTAPAPGVIPPGYDEPDTAFSTPTPTPAELSAATAAAAAAAAPAPAEPATGADQLSAQPMSPEDQAFAPVAPTAEGEGPTQVYDLPSDVVDPPAEPEFGHEPAVEAPGLDAKVGEAAAAFAGAAAGAGLAAKAASAGDDEAYDAASDAERRLKAKVAEIKAEQARGVSAPVPPASEPLASEPEPAADIEAQLDEAEDIQREIESAEAIPPTPTGLVAVEQRLQANSDERDRTLRDAEERLVRIEQRAQDAEKRAAFAERLAQLKIDESDRERRLNDVITGIDRAEVRAIEAEERAKAAEEAASAALEESTAKPVSRPDASRPAPAQAQPAQPHSSQPPVPESSFPAPSVPSEDVPSPPAVKSPLFGSGLSGGRASSASLNLNNATFEELRDADLSVTQATRILAYRERFGGYRSVEDLEKVPGFPAELIESLRGRISV